MRVTDRPYSTTQLRKTLHLAIANIPRVMPPVTTPLEEALVQLWYRLSVVGTIACVPSAVLSGAPLEAAGLAVEIQDVFSALAKPEPEMHIGSHGIRLFVPRSR